MLFCYFNALSVRIFAGLARRFLVIVLSVFVISPTLADVDINMNSADELPIRNPYNANKFVESEHFVFWYSDKEVAREPELVEELLRIESALEQFVNILGYISPVYDYKMNIYLEDAGSEIEWLGYTGLAGLDIDGYPYIMMGTVILDLPLIDLQYHNGHELFHTTQFGYNAGYATTVTDRWFVEASAGWGGVKAWNDTSILNRFVWIKAPRPDLSLNHLKIKESSSETTTPENSHQYSMALFLHYLTDETSDALMEQVFSSIKENVENAEYLSVLNVLETIAKDNYARDLGKIYAEYAAKNINWDFPYGEQLKREQQNASVRQSDRYVGDHQRLESTWNYIDNETSDLTPLNWGAAYMHFINSENLQTLDFSFKAEDNDINTNTRWLVTLVLPGNEITYVPIEVIDGKVDNYIINTAGIREFWISVTPIKNNQSSTDKHHFAYQFAEAGRSATFQVKSKVEAKSSGGGGSINWLILSLLFLSLCYQRFYIANEV